MSSNKTKGCGSGGFQIYKLEAFCDRLMVSSNHFEAVHRLKRLHEFQPGNVKTMLMMMECYICLEKYDESLEVVKMIRDAVLQGPRPEARELISEADESKTAKKYITSIIFLWCACAVYEADRNSKDALDGIAECLYKMSYVLVGMQDNIPKLDTELSDQYLKRFCTIFLLLMIETERQLEGLRVEDLDLYTRVLLRCLGNKADCMAVLERFEDAIEISESCIDRMNQQFGANVSKSYMFGEFMFNAAVCYLNINDYDNGFAYARKAYDSLTESQPVSAEERKLKEELLEVIAAILNIKKGSKVVSKLKGKFSKLLAKFRK